MDPQYNGDRARALLENIQATTEASHDEDDPILVSAINISEYQVVYVHQPHSWRLSKHGHNDDFEEEVFHIFGILCGSDLPPLHDGDVAILRRKARFMRQAVRLTGLGAPSFEKSINTIRSIEQLLSTALGKELWQDVSYEGHTAMDATARYFTPRNYVPRENGQAFEHGVDPNGVLAAIRGQDLIHGSDNKVIYLRKDKQDKIDRIEPREFNIGDIVRATVSFVGFQSNDKAKMTIMLKALTLVESAATVNMESQDVRHSGYTERNIPKTSVIKRKIIFDEAREVRKGINKMNL